MNIDKMSPLEKASFKFTNWVGSPISLLVHTILFLGSFSLTFFGFDLDTVLLVLTTVVSLEAIYLAIFIQMTVNRNTASLEEVEDDIEDIQEDVKGLEEDVEGITEDLEEIQEDENKEQVQEKQDRQSLLKIEKALQILLSEVNTLKKAHPQKNSK